MSQFGSQPVISMQELIIDDHATADACADGQIEHVMMTTSGAKFPFTQCAQVGIVVQIGGHTKMVRELSSQREIDPLRNVGRGDYHAAFRVERAGGGHADSFDSTILGPG